MKNLIPVRTALLLVLMFVAIQAGAKDIYIKPGTGTTPTIDNSTADDPAPFSLLSAYLSSYRVDTTDDKQLNVYFDIGTYTVASVLTFNTTASRVNGLEVTFRPLTPSNGGAKWVTFDGTGTTTSRFIQLRGDATNSMSMLIEDVRIENFVSTASNDTGASSLFTMAAGASLTLDNVIINQIESRRLSFVYQRVANSSFTVRNSELSNITIASGSHDYAIINCNSNTSSTSFENCTLDAWRTNNYAVIYASNFSLNGCTIKDFVTTGSNGNIIRTDVSGTKTEIANNSFINNNNTATAPLVNFINGTSVMYNNTLSGNTSATVIALATADARVINNTIYNSGNVTVTNASARMINNIAAGGSTIAGAQANATTCQRNISGGNYYLTGITGGTDISAAFSTQFNTTLSGTANGRIVHELVDSHLGDANHAILQRGGTRNDLSGVLSDVNILTLDQKGSIRPDIISVGAVDMRNYEVSNPNIVISFDSRYAASKTPASLTIDILDYIVAYPFNITVAETNILLSNTTLSNGTLSPLQGKSAVTFSPEITGGEYTGGILPATFNFTVSATSGSATYSKTGSITITVLDMGTPPGHIKPTDFPLTCYDYMGTVAFTSSFRFITSYTGNTDPVTGNSSSVSKPLNLPAQRMYGFSIPLVGDLDGDGYPEIIGMGRDDGGTVLNPHYNFLYIYNGQTGEQISRLPFDLSTGATNAGHSGYHGSPSIMALVDADRDGKIEVIVAFPSAATGSFPYANKLASYVLTPVKNGAATTGYTMSLNPLWPSTPQYNTESTSYRRAIPQIVDINGDGEPEVVVYNKIYSAKTGALKVTLEKLGNTAYVGAVATGARSEDALINFSYIYDLDLDGNYDVVAGGKVYYNIDVNTGTYDIRDFSATVKDGRTGVADIDGDGIPDVVVVNRNTSVDNVDIYVWDPGFLKIDGGGNVVRKALTPLTAANLKAHRSLPFARTATGTNSYVYIGDIDGREQMYNGKTYRLPEIAVLSGTLTYSSPLIHPNVQGLGIPTSGNSSGTGRSGVLAAVTWDTDASSASDRLKLSFVLGHDDSSGNTGFTMFDFDNDGKMEICYRDEDTLRIIKASTPYVTQKELDPNIVLFKQKVLSYTGFEYPVIADIDNDASAEVIVIGQNASNLQAYGYIYAFGNGSGDKFAPALPVWNQFMYDPFKINPDLTTPVGPARNRLDYKYHK
ncbi:MAG: VCBS repeat-containing protein, partial [Tannerellaceae bacterium]|nr:VCBS repeat-containing protein [Tannerellaceae bacterium]